jgi:hypothetical protein
MRGSSAVTGARMHGTGAKHFMWGVAQLRWDLQAMPREITRENGDECEAADNDGWTRGHPRRQSHECDYSIFNIVVLS